MGQSKGEKSSSDRSSPKKKTSWRALSGGCSYFYLPPTGSRRTGPKPAHPRCGPAVLVPGYLTLAGRRGPQDVIIRGRRLRHQECPSRMVLSSPVVGTSDGDATRPDNPPARETQARRRVPVREHGAEKKIGPPEALGGDRRRLPRRLREGRARAIAVAPRCLNWPAPFRRFFCAGLLRERRLATVSSAWPRIAPTRVGDPLRPVSIGDPGRS